ncbi:MAG: CPBP family intramembrane glutamic endopeptidase [Myxococcota bacterium]
MNPNPAQQDARIFGLILKGHLRESSSVADDSGGPAIALSEHPRYAKVLELARLNRSLNVLRNASWWASRNAAWEESLHATHIGKVILKLALEHATGFLTVVDGDRAKVIAISSGVLLCISSNLKREQLDQVLGKDNEISNEQVRQAQELAQGSQEALEWALLQNGVLDVQSLLQWSQRLSRERLFDLFVWRSGDVRFHPDDRATQLHGIFESPLLALLRGGMWFRQDITTADLRQLCAPILEHREGMRLSLTLGTLQFSLTPVEKRLLDGANTSHTAAAVLQSIETADQQTVAEALKAIYLFFRLGILEVETATAPMPELADLMAPPVSAIASGANAPPPTELFASTTSPIAESSVIAAEKPTMKGASQLEEYRHQLRLEQDGRRLLNGGQAAEAATCFEELVGRQERPIDALAYLALSTLLAGKINAQQKAMDYLQRAYKSDPKNPLVLAVFSRVHDARNEEKAAKKFRRAALSTAEHNANWLSEVEGLLEVGTREAAKRRKQPPSQTDHPLAGLIALAIIGLLLILSNVVGLGKVEYFYSGTDWFFYLRRGLLLLGGLIGLRMVSTTGLADAFAALGWRVGWKPLALAVGWGLILGYLSPPQRVTGSVAIVLSLTALHVFSEELFFRGFITRALIGSLGDWGAAVIGGLIFGLYHMTFYSFWHESPPMVALYWSALIGIFAGIPYSLLQVRTKSILPPLACHFTTNATMMLLSIFVV